MAAIQNQLRLMCSVQSTAHFKDRKSIMTYLTQAHRDQIVGMLLETEAGYCSKAFWGLTVNSI